VQFGDLVVGELDRRIAVAGERRDHVRGVLPRPRRDADEDVGLVPAAEAVVEFGDDAASDRRAEFAEGAGPLGNRDAEQRLVRLAELRPLGDEAQPIEVHVGAAQDGREPRARRLHDREHHLPHFAHRDAVREDADAVERHAATCLKRLIHGVSFERLDADDSHRRLPSSADRAV